MGKSPASIRLLARAINSETDSEVLAHPCGEDEYMEELMETEVLSGAARLLERIEDRADGVEQTANQDWHQDPETTTVVELRGIDDCYPAKD